MYGLTHPTEFAAMVGSQVWGYPVLMGLGRVLTGGSWLGAKVALSVLSATGAVAAYGLAVASRCTPRRAALAGLLVGVSPSLLLWDAWGLKDTIVMTLVLWILLAQVRLPFWLAALATAVGIQFCLYMRPVAAVFVGVAFLPGIRRRRSHLLGLLAAGALAVAFVLPHLTSLLGRIDSLEIESGTPLRFDGGPGSENLLQHPWNLGKFLFGPTLAFGPGAAGPDRWLYISTVLWGILIALTPAVIRRAWADASGFGRRALLGSAAYAAIYLLTFGATFYRQRSLLECMLLITVVLYLRLPMAAAVTRVQLWLAFVAVIAVLQSSNLAPTLSSKIFYLALILILVLIALSRPVSRISRWRSDRQPGP
jgi:hypothetical protein